MKPDMRVQLFGLDLVNPVIAARSRIAYVTELLSIGPRKVAAERTPRVPAAQPSQPVQRGNNTPPSASVAPAPIGSASGMAIAGPPAKTYRIYAKPI